MCNCVNCEVFVEMCRSVGRSFSISLINQYRSAGQQVFTLAHILCYAKEYDISILLGYLQCCFVSIITPSKQTCNNLISNLLPSPQSIVITDTPVAIKVTMSESDCNEITVNLSILSPQFRRIRDMILLDHDNMTDKIKAARMCGMSSKSGVHEMSFKYLRVCVFV